MPKISAGILAYRFEKQELQVLLVHPGGPFYKNKDEGVWSIPKGEYDEQQDALTVAKREFEEETGNSISGNFIALTPIKIKSGKVIGCWAVEANFEQPFISSNYFEMEFPPKSGKMQIFAETDKAEWFTIKAARKKIHTSQILLLDELVRLLK